MKPLKAESMNSIFVTADHHFGHANIIKFYNRPFGLVKEMDEILIANWNEVIKKDDVVFHLGDFTLGDFDVARNYFKQLNGNIQVLGNHWHHDKRWLPKNFFGPMALECPDFASEIGHVDIVPPMVVLEIEDMGNEGRPLAVTLCHYPLAVWDRKHYGAWHLYGHTHKHDQSGDFALNVGVDCTRYYPTHLGHMLEHMREKGFTNQAD